MPRERLAALQLERLRATIGADPRARPAAGPAAARRPGSARPRTSRALDDLARLPFTVKADLRDHYPFGLLAVPREEVVARPRLERDARQADRRRLHARRPGDLGRGDGAHLRARRRAAGDGRPQRLRLRPLHRRARLPLRRRADGLHGRPDVGRRHAAAGHDAARPRRRGALRDAVVRAAHRPGARRGGGSAGRAAAEGRPVRRRAVDRADAGGARGAARAARDQLLRAVRDRRAGRGGRVRGGAGRRARAGGPLPGRGRRPGERPAAAGRAGGRAGPHDADQGGAAAAALPHRRPVGARPGALPVRADDRPDGARARPARRHADRPRRQPLPVRGRAGPARPAAKPGRTTSSSSSGRPRSTS